MYAVAPHVPCGVITPDLLRKLADAAEKYNVAAVKITSAARIALVGIKKIKKIIEFYKENGKKLERIGTMIDRVGFETFQAAILGG